MSLIALPRYVEMANESICAPCVESPLSMAANIIAIATFIYVLLVGASYRATALRRAAGDVCNMMLEAHMRRVEFEHWKRMRKRPDTLLGTITIEIATVELSILDSMLEEYGYRGISFRRSTKERTPLFWSNWRFVVERNRLREHMDRFVALFESAKAVVE
jgi:hypothetical protein